MAITDNGKLFESTSTSDPRTHTLTTSVPAGALIVLYLGGTRSGSNLDLVGVTDSKGNVWQKKTRPSTISFCGIAWTRTGSPMVSGDTITVNWNGTPSKAWVSAHAFLGASSTSTDTGTGSATSSTASETLTVDGSDWLTVASVNAPYEYGVTMTPINSSISQDDNGAATAAPWCEAFSRNGTTGTTHAIGGTFVVSLPWAIAAVSFPAEAISPPAGVGRVRGGVIGV